MLPKPKPITLIVKVTTRGDTFGYELGSHLSGNWMALVYHRHEFKTFNKASDAATKCLGYANKALENQYKRNIARYMRAQAEHLKAEIAADAVLNKGPNVA